MAIAHLCAFFGCTRAGGGYQCAAGTPVVPRGSACGPGVGCCPGPPDGYAGQGQCCSNAGFCGGSPTDDWASSVDRCGEGKCKVGYGQCRGGAATAAPPPVIISGESCAGAARCRLRDGEIPPHECLGAATVDRDGWTLTAHLTCAHRSCMRSCETRDEGSMLISTGLALLISPAGG